MSERPDHEPATGVMFLLRAILATMTVLLLVAAHADLSRIDPYQFCWHYIRLVGGF